MGGAGTSGSGSEGVRLRSCSGKSAKCKAKNMCRLPQAVLRGWRSAMIQIIATFGIWATEIGNLTA